MRETMGQGSRRFLRFCSVVMIGAPLWQFGGCTLFEPRNLWRIGFDALLVPLNEQVFNFITAAAGT